MQTNTRREKILNSINKLQQYQIHLILHIIGCQCILAAKTNKAKQRLVETAILITAEDVRRLWMHETKKFITPRKIQEKTFMQFLKELF